MFTLGGREVEQCLPASLIFCSFPYLTTSMHPLGRQKNQYLYFNLQNKKDGIEMAGRYVITLQEEPPGGVAV